MKKTSKRLLAMLLSLIMTLSMANGLIFSASAANTPTKLSTALSTITTACTVTIKPISGSIDIQGYKIPGAINLYIKDKNVAAVASVAGFLKVKLLLTPENVFVMLPFFRVFAKMGVADLLTKFNATDATIITNGITIGEVRADPIAGIKKLYTDSIECSATAEGVSLAGVTGTFSTETYSEKYFPSNTLFTCYFSGDKLAYVKIISSDVAAQDMLTFKIDITNTVLNTNVFKEPKFFYFDLTTYIMDGILNRFNK